MDERALKVLKARRRRPGMTGWFDPSVLAQSATMMVTANIFGRHSDTRLIEALGSQPQESFDYSGTSAATAGASTAGASSAGANDAGEFWIDYVADIGDGWNATYAIADAVSRDELEGTRAGQVLVFGGDEVYPYPSRDAYALRSEAPYQQALAARAQRPDVFAIPGNHDWFDSLVAFSRTFCRPERGFAGCRTRQTRSYFALHLPRDWWLVGIDLQLGADFDEPQIRYFQRVAAQMSARSNVILCVPEPLWVLERTYPNYESYSARTIDYFEQEILHHPVRLTVSGDLHFYKRHAGTDGSQKVIAGGGGGFLHPTHKPDTQQLRGGFEQKACYPAPDVSRRLAWKNLLFPFLNPKACWLPALVYALSAWFASARLNLADIDTFPQAIKSALTLAVRDPFSGLWLMLVIAGLMFFTDTHSKVYRLLGGGLHAIAHLFAALGLAWLSMRFTISILGMNYGEPQQLLLAGALTFASGALVGGFVIGIYLLISILVFGRHYNEAYSSLRIADYKQWLRLRIGADGVLTGWCMALDRVPRKWREVNDRPASDDPLASAVRVVDQFSVKPRA